MAVLFWHNASMVRLIKWVLVIGVAGLLVLGALAFGLHRWVSTDDFRARAEAQATAALGVPVQLGSIAVDVWPLPAVALGRVDIQSKPPVTLERIEVRPRWLALLQGRLEIATLVVRKAVLPQQGIDAILLAMQKKQQSEAQQQAQSRIPAAGKTPAGNGSGDADATLVWLPRRTLLDDVTWVSDQGAQTALEGEARLGDDGLPDAASLHLIRGNLRGLKAQLKREDTITAAPVKPAALSAAAQKVLSTQSSEQWALRIDVGGGKVEGKLGLQRMELAGGRKGARELVVRGQLETRDVEVSALTAPNRPLSGLLEASTTLHARAATTSGLVEAMQTRTRFTVHHPTLNGIDLIKAINTVGLSRGGQTRLDTLSGQAATQGKAAQLTNLVASSGVLSASGNVAVSPAKALSGQVSVSLSESSKIGNAVGGAVAVPLQVGGTLGAPEVTLSPSAVLGTGANLGNRIKGLFGK